MNSDFNISIVSKKNDIFILVYIYIYICMSKLSIYSTSFDIV